MNIPSLVAAQRGHFQSHVTLPVEYRLSQLRALERALTEGEADLMAALRADLGKPPLEAFLSEIGFVLGEIRHALRRLPRWMKPRRAGVPLFAWPGRGWVRPEPRGVALIIGPWNYPVQLHLAPLAGAIAAGNCAVLKLSEHSPHTSAVIARLLRQHFPPEYILPLEGGRPLAEELLRERFDHIFFTGSTATGRAVMTAAAQHLTPVTLELGGKSPCIVCADAPLQATARRILWGKCLNAGQTCVAPDYLLVDRRIAAPLIEEMRKTLHCFYGDDPQQSPDYARIIHHAHFERLAAFLNDGTILHGGQHDAATRYFAPTLLGHVKPDSPVMQEEIFGPILPVIEFETIDQALHLIRSRPDPLALYLFTQDRAVQQRVELETRSGGLCINDTLMHLICKELPFGGRGHSGIGAYHGQHSFETFSHHKSIVRRPPRAELPVRYPPAKISVATVKRGFHWLMGG